MEIHKSLCRSCFQFSRPGVTKYTGLVCARAHRQELIQDLYKTWHDPVVKYPGIQMVRSSGVILYMHQFDAHIPRNLMFKFVPNQKQDSTKRRLKGVHVFTAQNLSIMIATTDGIKCCST